MFKNGKYSSIYIFLYEFPNRNSFVLYTFFVILFRSLEFNTLVYHFQKIERIVFLWNILAKRSMFVHCSFFFVICTVQKIGL